MLKIIDEINYYYYYIDQNNLSILGMHYFSMGIPVWEFALALSLLKLFINLSEMNTDSRLIDNSSQGQVICPSLLFMSTFASHLTESQNDPLGSY